MRLLTGIFLIVFLAISSFAAHAGMALPHVGDQSVDNHQMSAHAHHQMAESDAAEPRQADHEGEPSGCSFGHCAIACAVILSHFSYTASDFMLPSAHAAGQHRLTGEALAFEPPPPKA
jgi:hypothetical protein